MNIINILTEIEKVDAEVYERLNPRRKAMSQFFGFGKKAVLASLPLAFGAMFKKAYSQTPNAVLDVLNFALTLEHLEYNYYKVGVEKAPIPAGAPAEAIKTIRDHELAHVKFLQTAITQAGGTPVAEAKYDFTAKGTFPAVFSDYATFLAVAQAFEDTGVRAYKGQAGALVGTGGVLTAALNIHSVEARHASHIRQMRKNGGFGDVKPWITGRRTGIGAVVQPVYEGEQITKQATIEIVNINGQSEIDTDAASESFDEPLTKEAVTAIVTPFFA